MRRWIARSWFVLIALLGPVALAPIASPALAQAAQQESAALDALFAELKSAPDAAAARGIVDKIWIYWTRPADRVLARRMRDVIRLRRSADIEGALAELDAIVIDYPTYAEAWNQRATIHFLLGDFDQSLADIDKVLQYEPRHFGALAGRAMIYLNQDKRDLALQSMSAALAINPFLAERALFPELMEHITYI